MTVRVIGYNMSRPYLAIANFRMYIVSINNILLTVLGVVVGLALSFQSSTAYDR